MSLPLGIYVFASFIVATCPFFAMFDAGWLGAHWAITGTAIVSFVLGQWREAIWPSASELIKEVREAFRL